MDWQVLTTTSDGLFDMKTSTSSILYTLRDSVLVGELSQSRLGKIRLKIHFATTKPKNI